jgi:hypothetical protein
MLPPAAPAAPPAKPSRLHEDNLLLFTVRLGNRVVAENFPGYPLGGKSYLLPLGEFCRAVGLGIKVDPVRGTAKGFIIREAQTFELDLGRNQAVVAGKVFPLDRDRVEWHVEDIYLDDAYLPRWLPLTLAIDPFALVIQVDPLEELPIQGHWRREEFMGRKQPDPGSDPTQQYPVVRPPYALADWPFLDQTLSFSYQPDSAPGVPKVTATGSSFLAGDLGFMSSTLFFNSRPGDLFSNPRGRLFRRDPDAGLLGPMKANIVEFGDIFVPTPSLVGGSPLGRGVHIGNFPEQVQSATDRYALQGDLLPGWSVELYQNDVLIDLQLSRPDGQYVFTRLPLLYGVNDFRLLFYGPEGQRREEHHRLDISQSQTPEGAFLYNLAGTRPGDGTTNYQVETAYGLAKQLDLRATLSQLPVTPPPGGAGSGAPLGNGQFLQRFTTASMQGYWPGFSTRFGAAQSSAGGTVQTAALGTGWGRASLNLEQSFLNGFYSPEFSPTHGLITERTRAQVNLALPPWSWLPSTLQLGLGGTRDSLEGGGHNVQTTRGYYLSNLITWNRFDSPLVSQDRREGLALVSKSFRDFSLRGEAGYHLTGWNPTLESLTLNGDTRIFQPMLLQGSVTRDLVARDNRYSITGVRQEGPVGVSFSTSYSHFGKFSLGLGLHIALGREPRTGQWVASSTPMAGEGALSGLAFLDSNGNGVRAPGEPALEGAGLSVNGTPRAALYPGDGAIFTPNVRPDAWATVSLAEGTVEDPLVKPRIAGYRVLPRVGKAIPLDFPLVVGGEITGDTRIQTAGGPEPLGGVRLELLDAEGRLKLQVVSAFDGFFDLADLGPGSYTLRVAPAEAGRLGVSLPPPRVFTLDPKGTQYDGIQLILTPAPRP